MYKCHTVSSMDSTRTNKENIDSLVRKYGWDSNVVRVRVRGEFPNQEDDVFIPLSIIEQCSSRLLELDDTDGIIYPCLRYMESSLAGQQEPYSIGDVDTGICQTECDRCRVECLKKIDRRTQSTDECFNCPVAEGCSWCTAYNYQVFGTPDARATYICDMHKARALGNIYFWNHYYEKNNIDKHMENHVPEEWALNIISKHEWDMLCSL